MFGFHRFHFVKEFVESNSKGSQSAQAPSILPKLRHFHPWLEQSVIKAQLPMQAHDSVTISKNPQLQSLGVLDLLFSCSQTENSDDVSSDSMDSSSDETPRDEPSLTAREQKLFEKAASHQFYKGSSVRTAYLKRYLVTRSGGLYPLSGGNAAANLNMSMSTINWKQPSNNTVSSKSEENNADDSKSM